MFFVFNEARAALGALPERIEVRASGNVIKNVKSVVVPGTNGGRGIAVAAAIGVLGGDGLVVKGVENSIASFSRLARVGMKETDQEIIRMMTE